MRSYGEAFQQPEDWETGKPIPGAPFVGAPLTNAPKNGIVILQPLNVQPKDYGNTKDLQRK